MDQELKDQIENLSNKLEELERKVGKQEQKEESAEETLNMKLDNIYKTLTGKSQELSQHVKDNYPSYAAVGSFIGGIVIGFILGRRKQ
jgi:chromosome segregation ATPase